VYLMYVDESGDTGIQANSTDRFVLTGMVFHELRWQSLLDDLVDFRKQLRVRTGFKVRDEIHSQEMINGRKSNNRGIERHLRLQILKWCIDWIAAKPDIRIITICVSKQNKIDAAAVFELAWESLIQRFENTLSHRNFTGPANSDDRGLLIPDNTNGQLLIRIVRRMRRYNPITNNLSIYAGGYRNMPLGHLVEDPFTKDSADSLFLQMADVVAYFAFQMYRPNKFIKKQGARNYFQRLLPVLLTVASAKHPLGIVER